MESRPGIAFDAEYSLNAKNAERETKSSMLDAERGAIKQIQALHLQGLFGKGCTPERIR